VCTPDRLKLLLDDTLPPGQQDAMIEHLDDCSDCQHALEQLAAERSWWQELRQLPAVARAVPLAALALGGSFRSGTSRGPRPAAPEGRHFGFLEPGAAADRLGRLGPCAVRAVLGQGGMGIVLSAFDPILDRPVAIKVMAPHFASSAAARRRFNREARAAAA